MAGQSDHQPPHAGATGVPDLIERYRLEQDAWIAQTAELARLRDEVRGSAEREAMKIVTAACCDVRTVIMEARRELLVLSAQVQAALGETLTKTDPTTLLAKAGITSEAGARNTLTGTSGDDFAPEDAVNDILKDVHEDIAALAEDARALPLQAAPPRQIPAAVSTPPIVEAIGSSPTGVVASAAPEPPIEIQDISPLAPPQEPAEIPGLSESASKVFLSSPFASDALPVQSDRWFRPFLTLFVGVGVVGVTIWWLSSGGSTIESSVATTEPPSQTSAPGQTSEATLADRASRAPDRATRSTTNLSVAAQAVRDVWVRTTIDGRTDGGRTLEAGQSVDLSAEQSISLRVGDAGAIVVSINSGEKRPLGRDGQVVTRQFLTEGNAGPARAPAPEPVPARAPAAPPASARTPRPAATAAPAVSLGTPAPLSIPSSPGNVAAANPPSPPPPPAATPGPASQVADPPQLSVPSGVVNQLSTPTAPLAAPAAAAVPTPASPATVVVAIARQWLDAYHRQDRAAMAALSSDNLLLADERRADERFPSGLADITRRLDRVSVRIAGDTAVLTAVMTEQSTSVPSSPHVSPISQVWVLAGGQWKVQQARIVSETKLDAVFK